MRADASVIVLGLDDEPRRPEIPRSADSRRRFHIRPGPLLGIVAVHVAAIALAIAMPGEIVQVPETEPLVTVFIRPKVVVARDPSVTPRAIRVPKAAPLLPEMGIPDEIRPVTSIVGVGTMAPRPGDDPVDPHPFALRAGLQPGQGATVVLRLRVLSTGEIDDALIEVSSGSPIVDEMAIAYLRASQWVGGAVDGQPAAIWIRWGVRLQG